MINDATKSTANRLKHVDDLTAYQSCQIDGVDADSKLQKLSNDIEQWATRNKMIINTDKCQIMHFFKSKKPLVLPYVIINGKSIPISTSSKLFGVKISSTIAWQEH